MNSPRNPPAPVVHELLPLSGKRTPIFLYKCFHCPKVAHAKRTGRQFGEQVADVMVQKGGWNQHKSKWICPECWEAGKRGEVPSTKPQTKEK